MSEDRSLEKRGSLTRRQFIGLAAKGLVSGILSGCRREEPLLEPKKTTYPPLVLPSPTPTRQPGPAPAETPIPPDEKLFQPELIGQVEVFGLGVKITSERELLCLYDHLDNKYAEQKGVIIGDKVEQRKELLDPSERYLEVAVRQSAYDSFLERRSETGADFTQWIQMHVDAMNRCFENAKPPAKARSVLRRIIVVADEMPKSFWEESDYKKGQAEALDQAWERKFFSKYPLDTDASWAIASDYCPKLGEESRPYFWNVCHQEGRTIFSQSPKTKESFSNYVFPEKDDSLKDKDNVSLDFGLIHEWSHRLWNLPDEYPQNVHDSSQRFLPFILDTGLFALPRLSPYLSMFLAENIRKKARSFWYQNRTGSFSDRPAGNTVVFSGGLLEEAEIKIHRIFRESGFYDGRRVSDVPEQEECGNRVVLKESLFEGIGKEIAPVWLFLLKDGNGEKQLYIPGAVFQMSKFAGLEQAVYQIEFAEGDSQGKKTQAADIVDESDLPEFLEKRSRLKEPLYAKMKVPGTNVWLIWFLKS